MALPNNPRLNLSYIEASDFIHYYDKTGLEVARVRVGSDAVTALHTGIQHGRGSLKCAHTGEFIIGTLDQITGEHA